MSREDYAELRRQIIAVQKPFVDALVDLYATAMPRITMVVGRLAEYEYPKEVEEVACKIRQLMCEAVQSLCHVRGLNEGASIDSGGPGQVWLGPKHSPNCKCNACSHKI